MNMSKAKSKKTEKSNEEAEEEYADLSGTYCSSVYVKCSDDGVKRWIKKAVKNNQPPKAWKKYLESFLRYAYIVSGEYEDCEIYVDEDGCIATYDTEINIVGPSGDIEISDDGVVRVISTGEVYIYPKQVLEPMQKMYIDPLSKGEPPASNLLIIAGTPGTGKTTLANIIADASGAFTKNINVSDVLSKWLGESEERIIKIFSEAREHAPAVIIMNDFDSIIRESRHVGNGGEAARAYEGIITSMLNAIDSLKNTSVLAIVTTNMSLTVIDPALTRRSYRFVLPPPTMEEKKRYLDLIKIPDYVPKDELLKYSTWAAITDSLKKSKYMGEFVPPEQYLNTAYYYIAEPIGNVEIKYVNEIKTKFERMIRTNRRFILTFPRMSGGNHFYRPEHKYVAEPLAYILSQVFEKPLIVAVRKEFVEDAITLAKQMNAIALIPGDTPDTWTYIKAPVIIAWAGEPYVKYTIQSLLPEGQAEKDYVFTQIAKYWDVPCDKPPINTNDVIDYVMKIVTAGKPCYEP
jgi:hypothetical protein